MTKYIIQYDPREMYGETNIYLKVGDKMSISTKILKSWKDYYIPSSLDGFCFPLAFLFPARWKTEKYYCLCGCIAKDNSTFFKIGKGIHQFEIMKEGLLYIFVNDFHANWAYRNNRGLVEMEILINKD